MMGGRLSGIGVRYPRRRGEHALVGRRMPDVVCADGRLYELLRDGRFVLLTRGAAAAERPGVRVAAHTDPRLPAAVLVRPDGYVAWASDTGVDPADAWPKLTFGPESASSRRQNVDLGARSVDTAHRCATNPD